MIKLNLSMALLLPIEAVLNTSNSKNPKVYWRDGGIQEGIFRDAQAAELHLLHHGKRGYFTVVTEKDLDYEQ